MAPSTLIPADAPPFVRAPQLARWLMTTPRGVFLWVQRGFLPEPIRLGPKSIWFNTAEVRAKLDARLMPIALPPQEGNRA